MIDVRSMGNGDEVSIARPRPGMVPEPHLMLVCPKCGSTYTRELEFCGLDGERLSRSDVDPLIGRTLDRYRVVAPIGSGGMARVYRATHLYLEQDFALKVLHGELASDRDLTRRFHREAKTLSKIKHPNVVTVGDFGATREGLLFMVMELLEGLSLSTVLRTDSPLHPPRAARLARQIAAGLSAAHGRGYVHRDLKPGNVMVQEVDGEEVAKLLDFGLVRILEPEEGDSQLTSQGAFFGTPSYMAPEQAAGLQATPASDLYALGVVIYHMVTGTAPFHGDAKQLAHQHITAAVPVPVLEYGGLTPIMMKLMEKDPNDRIASADAVMEAIDRLDLESRPPRRNQSMARAHRPKPALPKNADITGSDRPLLSAPILQEERSFLDRPDAEADMQRSIRAALGARRLAPWLVLFLMGGLGTAAAWWVREQAPSSAAFDAPIAQSIPLPEREEGMGEPIEAPLPPEPPAPNVSRPPPPPPPRASEKAPARPVEPPPPPRAAPPPSRPAPPPAVDPPTTVEATDYPTADEVEVDVARSYTELDHELGRRLSSRGLTFADIEPKAPQDAANWGRWYKTDVVPPSKILYATYDALVRAVDSINIDRALLDLKLRRARASLLAVPERSREARWEMVDRRHAELVREARQEPLRKSPESLASEITILEGDARGLALDAAKAPPPPPPPPSGELDRAMETLTSTKGR